MADVAEEELEQALAGVANGYDIVPVALSSAERDAFYHGFSNEIAWPLFHDLQTSCNFDPAYWDAYVSVNERFGRAIAERVRQGDLVWIHDYHLMLVGAVLRRLGVENRVGFFLHIPFPDRDIFRKLPGARPSPTPSSPTTSWAYRPRAIAPPSCAASRACAPSR
ncbi:MAG: trehalose-6-phosphate synthase [Sandaracinaceae bacterium]|nr:trehalose-6-phosphate synthase [Sandaracinaceae bacterium]